MVGTVTMWGVGNVVLEMKGGGCGGWRGWILGSKMVQNGQPRWPKWTKMVVIMTIENRPYYHCLQYMTCGNNTNDVGNGGDGVGRVVVGEMEEGAGFVRGRGCCCLTIFTIVINNLYLHLLSLGTDNPTNLRRIGHG